MSDTNPTELLTDVVNTNTELTNTIRGELGKWQTARQELEQKGHELLGEIDNTLSVTLHIDSNAADGGVGSIESPFNSIYKANQHVRGMGALQLVTFKLLSDYELVTDEHIGARYSLATCAAPAFQIDLNKHTLRFGKREVKKSGGVSVGVGCCALFSKTPMLAIYNGVLQFPSQFMQSTFDNDSTWFMNRDSTAIKFQGSRWCNQRLYISTCRIEAFDLASGLLSKPAEEDDRERSLLVGTDSGKHTYDGSIAQCTVVIRDSTFRYIDSSGEEQFKLMYDLNNTRIMHARINYYHLSHSWALTNTKFGLA